MSSIVKPPLTAVEKQALLLDKACGQLLLCLRSIHLYPNNHPRVAVALQAIQEAMTACIKECGRPFSIETSPRFEEEMHIKDPAACKDFQTFRAELKRHFIEKLTIQEGVDKEELYQLCFILHEDLLKKFEEKTQIVIDPLDWRKIQLSFYIPQDGVWSELEGSWMDRVAGLGHLRNLDAMFKHVSPEIRRDVQKALLDADFLQRISKLRKSMHQNLPAKDDGEAGKIDLVSEALQSILAETAQSEKKPDASSQILASLNHLVEFLEKHLEALAETVRSYASANDAEALRKQFREILQTGLSISYDVNSYQEEKKRLSFLFKTSALKAPAEKAAAPQAPAGQASAAAPPAGAPQPEPAAAQPAAPHGPPEPGSIIEPFSSISYDLQAIERMLQSTRLGQNYLQIVLELLAVPGKQELIRKQFPLIIKKLLGQSADPESIRSTIRVISDYILKTQAPDAVDLLIAVLSRVDRIDDLIAALESSPILQEEKQLESILLRLTDRDRERTIPLLCALRKKCKEPLRRIASSLLINLSGSSSVLTRWAMEDAGGLLEGKALKAVLEKISSEQLREAFKTYFSRVDAQQATQFIREIPADIPGAERILFAAMDSGSVPSRKMALIHLHRFPSPMVISMLAGVLQHNNSSGRFNAADVEAALSALVRINDPKAGAVLDKITERRTILYTYSKEIRGLLARLRAGKP